MSRTWGARLAVTAGLIGAGCVSTARPMLFHRNNNHAEPACCPGVAVPECEGPILGEMPVTAAPGGMMPPDGVVTPGMGLPPGTVTIPGPGATPAPPLANPPVGPVPRTAPAPQASPMKRPTT